MRPPGRRRKNASPRVRLDTGCCTSIATLFERDAVEPQEGRRRRSRLQGVAPRRPHAGLLRREKRALLRARETRLRDLGGLMVEMYSRGAFREDLLEERCAQVVGIDTRLEEIDELLHGRDGARALHLRRARAARLPLLPELRPPAGRGARRRGRHDDRAPARRQRRLIGWTRRTPGGCGVRRSPRHVPAVAPGAAPRQEYCVECGLLLPVVVGPIAALRSRWLRRFGWYPGRLGLAVARRPSQSRSRGPRSRSPSTTTRALPQPSTARRDRIPSRSARPGVGLGPAERPDALAGESQRLDGRPRLLPGDRGPGRTPRDSLAGPPERACPRSESSTPRATRASIPATTSSSAASTAQSPTPKRPSRPFMRSGFGSAYSRADCPLGGRREATRIDSRYVVRKETICNTLRHHVESVSEKTRQSGVERFLPFPSTGF